MYKRNSQPSDVWKARVDDALRWVAQEARAAVMLGFVGPNHETLRKALASLESAYSADDY